LRTQSTAILADGSVQTFDVHVAAIHWNGQWQTILIQSIDADPLLGMALIAGHDLNARVIDGGRVEIEAIP
jgi:predicted aspartyl protease